ncbi:hypothetical protein [Calycomorphotria hydatis]|uniref:Uncharacterized protein n=1 Tax=Calycomorphotria hydatis TaxID=2528027 RepID=A0A517T465_9PLAN|nr:hypothetical protein [Calycomorphotria hydatis]QDT63151.1 hypothetical protein V22_03690 [Calycomorphotria hydatis]
MNSVPTPQSPDRTWLAQTWLLPILGLLSLAIYIAITFWSPRFAEEVPVTERPILEVLGLFTVAFILYVIAIAAIRHRSKRSAIWWMLSFAVLFRLAMLFSEPIQEVDIYRYIWDGEVASRGINPFRYSPEQILDSPSPDSLWVGLPGQVPPSEWPVSFRELVELRDRASGVEEVLQRVHFNSLTSPYPPTSQAVFAFTGLITPESASLWTHLLVMKSLIVIFDLATIVVLIKLLLLLRLHSGNTIIYAWCPLIIKEFANSGHLDAITVFFTILTVYLLICAFQTIAPSASAGVDMNLRPQSLSPPRLRLGLLLLMVSASVLAIAVGGKLYPILIAPAFAVFALRHWGAMRTCLLGIGFIILVAVVLSPMIIPQLWQEEKPFPGSMKDTPEAGAAAFLNRWEINDLLFAIVVENVKPDDPNHVEPTPWFVVVPNTWRESILAAAGANEDQPRWQTPFYIARVVTTVVWMCICAGLCWQLCVLPTPENLLRTCFLIIAWFWLLCPTQNPWYWSWALIFLPFVTSRAWLAVAGFAMLYYLRFWLEAQYPERPILGTPYNGTEFSYFILPWIEFGPVLLWVAVESYRNRPLCLAEDGD